MKSNLRDRDPKPRSQKQTMFEYLRENEVTASMLEMVTGIHQKSICRYKRELEKAGRLFEIRKGICLKTRHRAAFLTTDPTKAPINFSQLNLF